MITFYITCLIHNTAVMASPGSKVSCLMQRAASVFGPGRALRYNGQVLDGDRQIGLYFEDERIYNIDYE